MSYQKTSTPVSRQPLFESDRDRFDYQDLTTHKAAVVGLGYVGLPLALTLQDKNVSVVGYDIDTKKLSQLKRGIADLLTDEETASLQAKPLTVGATPRIMRDADIFFVCVPTPITDDNLPDLSYLIEAVRAVGGVLKRGGLVLIESTIHPGTCDDVLIPILEYESGLSVEKDFYFAYCPERINPGDPNFTTKNIPRVLGAAGQHSLTQGLNVYRTIIDATITPMGSLKEAEAVKMVENSFRDVNIAFVNELAMAFDAAGIDTVRVINGAATKPFGFMAHYPGCGVGGHCIPVDPYYLIAYGRENGFTHHLLMTSRVINNYMPRYTVTLLKNALQTQNKSLSGARVALLGLAYKRGIGDLRESPALEILEALEEEGAIVRAFDPYVEEHKTAATLNDAVAGADAVIIATDHDEFTRLTPQFFTDHGVRTVIDGRNCLDQKAFAESSLTYHGIGRQTPTIER